METIVDRIRTLCRQKSTSITKIEAELGYANGTIGKWAKGKKPPPLEKVIAISDRLGTSVDFLRFGAEEQKKPPAQGGEPLHTVQDWKLAIDRMSQEECKEVMELLMKKFMEGGK